MPNLYVDSPNILNKYSESQLEVLLLEYIFKYEDRKSVFGKIRRLFRQERMWKKNEQQFPHGEWLRTTLKKIHANVKTKSFKDHVDANFGKKSNKEHGKWLSLDMKNFDEGFTIGHLSNSGRVDSVVGKTSTESRKLLDKRYQLSKVEKTKMDETIYDNVTVNIEPYKGDTSNVILQIGETKINKEDIFDENNIGYKIKPLNIEPIGITNKKTVEIDMVEWQHILNFETDEKTAHKTLKDTLWIEENIQIPDDIYNPYVNYTLEVIIKLQIKKFNKPKGSKYEVKIERVLIYDPIEEIKVSKKDSQVKYNEARDVYLSAVKSRFDRLDKMTDKLPEGE